MIKGVVHNLRRYVTGEAPTYDKSCWFDIKYSLGFDFPNLPYYVDGKKLSNKRFVS